VPEGISPVGLGGVGGAERSGVGDGCTVGVAAPHAATRSDAMARTTVRRKAKHISGHLT
jgi:hypothetical protein